MAKNHGALGAGFRNPWTASYIEHGPFDYFKSGAWWDLRRLETFSIGTVPLDKPRIAAPPEALQATWLGHASFLIQAGGFNIVTDPVFSRRCSPSQWVGPSRFTPTPCTAADLPPVHIVLLSHNHYDHIDADTIAAFVAKEATDLAAQAKAGAGAAAAAAGGAATTTRPYRGTLFVCPLGVGALLRSLGVAEDRIAELDWWDALTPASDAAGSGEGAAAAAAAAGGAAAVPVAAASSTGAAASVNPLPSRAFRSSHYAAIETHHREAVGESEYEAAMAAAPERMRRLGAGSLIDEREEEVGRTTTPAAAEAAAAAAPPVAAAAPPAAAPAYSLYDDHLQALRASSAGAASLYAGMPTIVAVPAQHHSARGAFDRNATLWCGYTVVVPVPAAAAGATPAAAAAAAAGESGDVIAAGAAPSGSSPATGAPVAAGAPSTVRFYFTGDTGYRSVAEGVAPLSAEEDVAPRCPAFAAIGRSLGPIDLSLLPIGAYSPRWFMSSFHASPEDSVDIHRDVRSRRSIGMHWGTFPLTDEPIDQPPQRLRAAKAHKGLPADDFIAVRIGATVGARGGPANPAHVYHGTGRITPADAAAAAPATAAAGGAAASSSSSAGGCSTPADAVTCCVTRD